MNLMKSLGLVFLLATIGSKGWALDPVVMFDQEVQVDTERGALAGKDGCVLLDDIYKAVMKTAREEYANDAAKLEEAQNAIEKKYQFVRSSLKCRSDKAFTS